MFGGGGVGMEDVGKLNLYYNLSSALTGASEMGLGASEHLQN